MNMTSKKTRPVSAIILMGLIFFQGLSGLAGGIGLVFDPTGKSVSLPIQWLENSPFDDYLIPGLILLIILGIFPLVVSYGLLKKLNWSWFGALLVGVALVIWIGVEIIIIGYKPKPPLQFIYGILGIIILVFVFLPSVRKYCAQIK